MQPITKEEIDKAFNLCAGNLRFLPEKYKKWKNSLYEYRKEWGFIFDTEFRKRIAEQEMSLDYLWSLEEWLEPGLVFEISHKLIFFHGLGAIYEAVLIDFWKKEMLKNKSKLLEQLAERVNFERFDTLISVSGKADVIDNYWNNYLHDLKKIRNLVHLPKPQKKQLDIYKSDLFRKSLKQLKEDLVTFRKFIQTKY